MFLMTSRATQYWAPVLKWQFDSLPNNKSASLTACQHTLLNNTVTYRKLCAWSWLAQGNKVSHSLSLDQCCEQVESFRPHIVFNKCYNFSF